MMKTNLMTTGIGSIPEENPQKAIGLVDRFIKDIPFWPQLPNRSVGENMIIQYANCLPFVKIDRENNRLYIDEDEDWGTSIAELYENIDNERYEAFALTNQDAAGFYRFLESCGDAKKIPLTKGHVTGALTLAVSIDDIPEEYDKNPKRIVHNETIMEILPDAVGMMGAWQVRKLSNIAERIIVFIDEPALSDYGSELHSVRQSPDRLKAYINQTVNRIKKAATDENVYVGMHCCGDSTWEHWLDTDLDIINFDSYSHWPHFYNRIEKIKAHINAGKILAFGIIPTAKEKFLNCAHEVFWNMLKGQIKNLVDGGVDEDRLIEQSMITPACGFGSEDVETCEKGFEVLMKVSEMARKEYEIT
jgi:methionine synthase II (cobalamin-independent)